MAPKMIFKVIILFAALALILTATGFCEGDSSLERKQDSTANMTWSITDIEWLVGHWKGKAFGGFCEEVWQPASGGTMTGTFKLIVNDEVKFYEMMVISAGDTGPSLRLKHFNADLTGWEEKDEVIEFSFLESGENEIRFEGLAYRKVSDRSLDIFLSMKDADGNVIEQLIICKKTDN